MYKTITYLCIIFILLGGCSKEKELPHQLAKAGQTKKQVEKLLGKPYKHDTFEKSNEQVWGPEEDFWYEIPMGTTLEVWSYKYEQGHLNVYFTEGDSTVSYTAFAPEGINYESTN